MKTKIFNGTNWVEIGSGGWDYNVAAGNDIHFNANYNGITFTSGYNKIWFDGTYLRAMVDDGYEVTLGIDGIIHAAGIQNSYNTLKFDAYYYEFHMQDVASSSTPGYYNDTLKMSINYNRCIMELNAPDSEIVLVGGYNISSHKYGAILCNYNYIVNGIIHNLHIYNTTTSGNKCNISCILRSTWIGSITSMTNLVMALYDAGHRGISSMLPANGLGYSTSACVIGIYASSRTASSITVVYTSTSSYSTSTFTASTLTITDFRNGQFKAYNNDI